MTSPPPAPTLELARTLRRVPAAGGADLLVHGRDVRDAFEVLVAALGGRSDAPATGLPGWARTWATHLVLDLPSSAVWSPALVWHDAGHPAVLTALGRTTRLLHPGAAAAREWRRLADPAWVRAEEEGFAALLAEALGRPDHDPVVELLAAGMGHPLPAGDELGALAASPWAAAVLLGALAARLAADGATAFGEAPGDRDLEVRGHLVCAHRYHPTGPAA